MGMSSEGLPSSNFLDSAKNLEVRLNHHFPLIVFSVGVTTDDSNKDKTGSVDITPNFAVGWAAPQHYWNKTWRKEARSRSHLLCQLGQVNRSKAIFWERFCRSGCLRTYLPVCSCSAFQPWLQPKLASDTLITLLWIMNSCFVKTKAIGRRQL